MDANSAQELIKKAMQLHQGGALQQAGELYQQVLASFPKHPDALHLFGLICHQQGDHATAADYIRRAVTQVPQQAVLRNNLGDALTKAGDAEGAISQFKIALELRPDYAGAHQNLASVYLSTGRHDAALEHARQAVNLNEDHAGAWFNLGLCLLDHVMLEDSADAFRRVLALQPNHSAAVTSLLYIINLLPDTEPAKVAEEHYRVATAAFAGPGPVPTRTDVDGRIRVGYVSGDFCAHAVNYFFEPVLELHDRSQFEIYCYADVSKPDTVTDRLQSSADHWRDIAGRNDDDVFEQLRADRIDILVDLAGYTKHSRTAVFARKPAPRQISWLGFPNTSGLEAMDYRVMDTFTAPVNEKYFGTEEALRPEPGFACFRPPAHAPSVQTAPLEENGFVTLGSIHKLEKLNPKVIGLWAAILRENPDTRLLLARDQLDQWQQQRLMEQFKHLGVDAHRLVMKQLPDPGQSFFRLFADMDILLDAFPWSGHTLACCALWMGVPVVSLYGKSHAGRMVASVLNSLDLDELIAEDEASYGRIAADLCNDHARLLDYRNSLRSRFENSSLRDEAGFTRAVEDQLKQTLK